MSPVRDRRPIQRSMPAQTRSRRIPITPLHKPDRYQLPRSRVVDICNVHFPIDGLPPVECGDTFRVHAYNADSVGVPYHATIGRQVCEIDSRKSIDRVDAQI